MVQVFCLKNKQTSGMVLRIVGVKSSAGIKGEIGRKSWAFWCVTSFALLSFNIKNIPIVIVDTEQLNNGNNVLSFYWEKDGLYQPILDEAAWSEVKLAIIDIIKNNFNVIGVE